MPNALGKEQRLARAMRLGIIVDEQDAWLLEEYTWTVAPSGHVRTLFKSRHTFIHNCIIGMPIRRNVVVDHIDNDPLNNCRDNLRYITKSKNRINARDIRPRITNLSLITRAQRGQDA